MSFYRSRPDVSGLHHSDEQNQCRLDVKILSPPAVKKKRCVDGPKCICYLRLHKSSHKLCINYS